MERSTQSLTDRELLDDFVRDRSEESFRVLVQRHKLALFNIAFRVFYDRHAAEDVVQRVFVKLVRRKDELINIRSPQSWLYATTLNLSLDMQESTQKRRKRESGKESLSSAETPREAAMRSELRKELDAALALLKNSIRVPIVLRYLQGLSYAEAGELMNLSSDAVRKRVKKGLKVLSKVLVARGLLLPVVTIEAGLRSLPAKATSADFLTSVSSIIKAGSTAGTAAGTALTSTSIVKGVVIMTTTKKIGIGVAVALLLGTITYFATRGGDKGPATSSRSPRQVAPVEAELSAGAPPEKSLVARDEDGVPAQPTGAEANELSGTFEDFDITGIVIDTVGNPIEGAVARLTFYTVSDDGSLSFPEESERLRYTTKEDGRFGFNYQEGKSYWLSADKEGYVSGSDRRSAPQRDIVITLSLGGAIEGKVVDAVTLEPVEQFRIVTTPDARDESGSGISSEEEVVIYLPTEGTEFNNPEGTFRIPGIPGQTWRLISIAEGHAQASVRGIKAESGKTTGGVVIEMHPAAGIRGHVVDSIGEPIEGAKITQTGSLNVLRLLREETLASSDPKGEFEIKGLPGGTFTLQARHGDYSPVEQKVAVKKGEITEGVEFQLLQGGMITGMVVGKADLQPIVGARVRASTKPPVLEPVYVPVIAERTSGTDESGLFRLTNLKPGTYALIVSAPDFAEETIKNLWIGENGAITDLIIKLSQGGSLVGTVRDHSGKPMVNIGVFAEGRYGEKDAQTDQEGKYAIVNLKEGNYKAQVVVFGEGSSRYDEQYVHIENDKETRLDIVLGGSLGVYGKVTLNGEPQAGMAVFIDSCSKNVAATKRWRGTVAQTDEHGAYAIANFEPGEYDMIVGRGRGSDLRWLFKTEIELTDRDLEKNIELPESEISGRVLDAQTREPIEGAKVALRQKEAKSLREAASSKVGSVAGTERTDSEGAYRFSVVQDGVYVVVASKEGYASQGLTAEVRNARGPSNLHFSLAPGEKLVGQVTGSDPSWPIRQIFLSARDSDGRLVFSERITLSEAGEYEAEGLSPGEHVISVDARGYASASQRVRIQAAGNNRADFILSAGGTLIIRAVDERGDPIPGARAKLMDEKGNFWVGFFPDHKELTGMDIDTILREDNVSVTPNVSEGKYRVEVSALGYEEELANVIVREGEQTEETVTLRKSR